MNKKLLLLGVAASFIFTACQKDELTEDVTNEAQLPLPKTMGVDASSKIHEPVFIDGIYASIHEPVLTGPGADIHEPVLSGGWFDCAEPYDGNGNLIVPKKDHQSYCADEYLELNKISTGGILDINAQEGVFVANTVNLHHSGVFNFMGDLTIGTEEDPQDLVINYASHFVFMGNVHVTGNLIINNGGTFEMRGEDSHDQHTFEVDGEIIVDEGAFIVDYAGDPSNLEEEHEHDH